MSCYELPHEDIAKLARFLIAEKNNRYGQRSTTLLHHLTREFANVSDYFIDSETLANKLAQLNYDNVKERYDLPEKNIKIKVIGMYSIDMKKECYGILKSWRYQTCDYKYDDPFYKLMSKVLDSLAHNIATEYLEKAGFDTWA